MRILPLLLAVDFVQAPEQVPQQVLDLENKAPMLRAVRSTEVGGDIWWLFGTVEDRSIAIDLECFEVIILEVNAS